MLNYKRVGSIVILLVIQWVSVGNGQLASKKDLQVCTSVAAGGQARLHQLVEVEI